MTPADPLIGSNSPYSPPLRRAASFNFTYPDPTLKRSVSIHLESDLSDQAAVESLSDILEYYRTATTLDPTYAKAWHEWAMLNAKVCTAWRSIISSQDKRDEEDLTFDESESSTPPTSHRQSTNTRTKHIVAAIRGFFRSISLQPVGNNSLQDILRILALWFEYGDTEVDDEMNHSTTHNQQESDEFENSIKQVRQDNSSFSNHSNCALPFPSPSPVPPISQPYSSNHSQDRVDENSSSISLAMSQGLSLISIDHMLAVIPQLLARIQVSNKKIRDLLLDLLCRLGCHHPQSLIFPLTVVLQSPIPTRHASAQFILDSMRTHSPNLVHQGAIVSSELVRVAIVWEEIWHEGIEEASRVWFGQNDFDGMKKIFEPITSMLIAPETSAELNFVQSYGKHLTQAWSLLQQATQIRSNQFSIQLPPTENTPLQGDQALVSKAWEIYSDVFRRITRHMGETLELELCEVSPKLLGCHELELCVPGSYKSSHSIVRIASFSSQLRIIESKQHPRRLSILGSDGLEYPFLLKGHEDLRQDERVMQLFGLVNTLLIADHVTSKKDLSIRRYEVIPLSPNSGLIEWIPNCETLHTIIKRYRDEKNIPLNTEQRLMLKFAPDFHSCTIMQKVEVFTYVLTKTKGTDLANVVWLHAPNSQTWLDRRECFTHSTAVMSMVGYILGLGDRHTCNIMLQPETGKLVHIDFGDCFEVAMHRDKYPEKVPFRLTRMMIAAMEVAGIEGTFRHTCQQVMRVLRKNKNSILAVLEAFTLDPLINWRLGMGMETRKKKSVHQETHLQMKGKRRMSTIETIQEEGTIHTNMDANINANKTSEKDAFQSNLIPPSPFIRQPSNPINTVDTTLPGANSNANPNPDPDLKLDPNPDLNLAYDPNPIPNLGSTPAPSLSPTLSPSPSPRAPLNPNSSSSVALVDRSMYGGDSPGILPPSPIHRDHARTRHSLVNEEVRAHTLGESEYPLPHHSTQANESGGTNSDGTMPTPFSLQSQAAAVLHRVEAKLRGMEFLHHSSPFRFAHGNAPNLPNFSVEYSASIDSVPDQVERLIQEATSQINLAQAYIGWCPFW